MRPLFRTLPVTIATALAACSPPHAPAAPALDTTDGSAEPSASARAAGPEFYTSNEAPPAATPPPAAPHASRAGQQFATADEAGVAALEDTTVDGGWGDGVISLPMRSGFTHTQLSEAQHTQHPALDACMERLVRSRPAFVGKTTFEIEIDARGHARKVHVTADDIHVEPYNACISAVFEGIAWPKPARGSATFGFEIVLLSKAKPTHAEWVSL